VRLDAYETSAGRVPYLEWFDGLDGTLRRAVQRRLRAIEERNQSREIGKARARMKDFNQRTK
jgi:hypothetical protein